MAGKKQKKGWRRVLRRIITTVIVLGVLALAAFIGINSLRAEYTITYTGYNATIGSISNSLSFSGSMALVDSKTYTASSAATVKQVYVAPGDRVAKNDKLIKLSNGEVIKADFDAVVNTVDVAGDDEVAAGEQLCQIADFDHMTVSVRVDEYDIRDVQVGQECTVTITATEQTFPSTIGKINYISSSTGNVAYYTATCDVTVTDGIYPGMQATVTVPQESAENVVVLKADALSFDETNSAFVYMYDEAGELARANVEIGVSNGNYVEIRSGVKAGDTVYVEVKETSASRMAQMMSSMFGSQNVRPGQGSQRQQWREQNGGGPGGFGGDNGGGR